MLISSEAQMLAFGEKFAKDISSSTVIELLGDVGAGKTTFTRGLAKGLGVNSAVTSPSFTISREYQGKKFRLVHYDFYRLANPGLMLDDLTESISEPNTVVVVEWGEHIRDVLPINRRIIEIKYQTEITRELIVK